MNLRNIITLHTLLQWICYASVAYAEINISPLSISAPGYFDVQISTDTPALIVAIDQLSDGNAEIMFDGESCTLTTTTASGNARLVQCLCGPSTTFLQNALEGQIYNLELIISMRESVDIEIGTISASVCPGYSSNKGTCSGQGVCFVDNPEDSSSIAKCTCATNSWTSGSTCSMHIIIPGVWTVSESFYLLILIIAGAIATSIFLLIFFCAAKFCCPRVKSSGEGDPVDEEDEFEEEHSVNPMPVTTTGIRFDKL